MSTDQILVLGALAGATIFIGLPLGRLRSVKPATTSFLSAMATGILLFLFWDVLAAAVEEIEARSDGGGRRALLLAGRSPRRRIRPRPDVARAVRRLASATP